MYYAALFFSPAFKISSGMFICSYSIDFNAGERCQRNSSRKLESSTCVAFPSVQDQWVPQRMDENHQCQWGGLIASAHMFLGFLPEIKKEESQRKSGKEVIFSGLVCWWLCAQLSCWSLVFAPGSQALGLLLAVRESSWVFFQQQHRNFLEFTWNANCFHSPC